MAQEQHDTADLLELAEQRTLTTFFLSQIYIREVSLEMLEQMRDEAPDTDGALNDFFERLQEADLEKVRVDLAGDYAQLFLGMSEHPVAPYESVFTSEEGLLMQKARDQVLALYREEGLDIPEGFGLPEDHIALEFDFLAFLSRKEGAALVDGDLEVAQEYRDKWQSFATDHIANWVPRMCDDVIARARTDFYRGIARMTKKFVDLI